ncbi:MAG: hypothetical protein M3441_15930 [Chloroflexota bacterium]|nr:hypothetical protein [Chloroflexota bacterium]
MSKNSRTSFSGARRTVVAVLAALLIAVIASGTWNASASEPSGGTAQRNQPSAPEGACPGGQCFADVPPANTFFQFVNSVSNAEIATGYTCGGPGEPCDAENRPYYRPGDAVTRGQMAKFVDNARHKPGIYIDTSTFATPLYVRTTAFGAAGKAIYASSPQGDAVYAESTSGRGVFGYSYSNIGVYGSGLSASSRGVHGTNTEGVGVYGFSSEGNAIVGQVPADSTGLAGRFVGDVEVTGACCAAAVGYVKVDHPTDPANSYLQHATVASPDMMNIYNGNVTTDANGEATVTMPEYFEALNGDFRYQLTPIGQFAQAIVGSKIKDNKFTIKTDKPNVEVSWQVTGVRKDPYAKKYPMEAEVAKPQDEQGLYRNPELYGQPPEKAIGYENLPDLTPEK